MPRTKITVTSPLLPDLQDFNAMLQEIWNSKWVTNNGAFHQRLEEELARYLKVPYISLFTNGTLPLITALQALRVTGEVITTPYSFVATTHSLWWNGIKPVFVDIDPATGNIDPDKIEAAITPNTTAIMPVHVYGRPCDTEAIQTIADRYGLRVIYDAAHAFGVEVKGESVLNAGDVSTLSFHATKVFNTIEGGAMVMHDARMKKRIDYLKNFGFASETEVIAPGINGKLDEIRSAVGLRVEGGEEKVLALIEKYYHPKEVTKIHVDFPIFVDARHYGMTRDQLYEKMKSQDILGRRYFYPLISEFSTYKRLKSAARENLPNAYRLASEVICLPLHHGLSEEEVERIIQCVKKH